MVAHIKRHFGGAVRFILPILVIAGLLHADQASAGIDIPISNEEQRVNGQWTQFGADQFLPDISSDWITWLDTRSHTPGKPPMEIWAKSLSTRDEMLVTTLSTDRAVYPRVAGNWVVWADNPHGNADIFARTLPGGPVVRVTSNDAHQINPDIDGTVVTWEDKRNVTEPPNIDILRKDLVGGSESNVTFAPGDQGVPVVSGDTVAWRDQRRGPSTWDVYARVGTGPETLVWEQPASDIPPLGTLGFAQSVALDGERVVWDHIPDCGASNCTSQLLTCVLPCAGGPVSVVDPVPSLCGWPCSGQIDFDVSGSRVVWGGSNFSGVFVKDMSSGGPVEVAASPIGGGSPEIEGTLVAWNGRSDDYPPQGQDIFWRDLASASPPLRANSLGFGEFEGGGSPTASGNNVVYHRNSKVFGTTLSPRDDFEVSSGLATGTGRPIILGSRAVWFEGSFDACLPDAPPGCTDKKIGEVFSRDPFSSGSITQLSSPDGTGGPPDIDGTKTAWRCSDTSLCVLDGTTLTTHDLTSSMLSAESVVVDRVRLAGNTLVWSEFESSPPASRLHALNLLSGDDELLGPADSEPVFQFDIASDKVVWTGRGGSTPGRSKVWINTAIGCSGPSPCHHSGSAVGFQEASSDNVEFGDVSIDGTRIAWVAAFFGPDGGSSDIYTRLLGEPGYHLVTDGSIASARDPYVDGDRIFWVYEGFSNLLSLQVMMESVTGAPLPQPELSPPAKIKRLSAAAGTSSIELSWINPSDSDLKGVRILRRSGTRAPTSPTDPTASIIFDGLASSFSDKDAATGVRYTYAAYAYDEYPNFAAPAIARS